MEDGTYTVVLDNIEDGLARLMFERDSETVGDRLVEEKEIPSEARHQDAIMSVELSDGDIVSMSYKKEKTKEREQKAQERFDRLSS